MARIDNGAVAYGSFTAPFVDALADILQGARVLEVFAGNGLLASRLAARGVGITATSLLSGHDGHERGLRHPVIEMDAVSAVREFGEAADVLLMSWPTTTEATTRAVLEWGSEKPVVFLGEITRRELGGVGLGGCATDTFFEATEILRDLPGYEPRNRLDRAVVLRARPEWVERYGARPGQVRGY